MAKAANSGPPEPRPDTRRSDGRPARSTTPAGDPSLTLELIDASAACIRWSVSDTAWAHLDSEFPGNIGTTRPVLRLRLVHCNGRVQEIASRDIGRANSAREGAVIIPLEVTGEYDAELGLVSEDGGWLALTRSGRLSFAGPTPHETTAPPPVPAPAAPTPLAHNGRPVATPAPARDPEAWDRHPDGAVSPPWGLLPVNREAHAPAAAEARALEQGHGTSPSSAATLTAPGPGLSTGENRGRGPATGGYATRTRGSEGPEVQVELLVYGSAPPGTIIDLYGRQLKVGPGGAFALRIPIQDTQLLGRALAEHPESEPE